MYEVRDPGSGERLALKLLVAVKTSLKRFNREYEAMTRLNHPNIVRVYHYGLHLGSPWLTMELLRGQPAQSSVKRTGRPGSDERTNEVLRVGYHVAKALHYIHDRKLVHRDLKSANVLVLPDDRIKLLDFGAAILLDGERITADNEFVGTFAYASPEQITGKALDHRSDLYSLGVLLFRLSTGQRPFESDEVEALTHAHLFEAPPDPRSITPNLPEPLVHLILSLLEKSPSARPGSADLVASRLEELRGRPFSTRSRLGIHDASAASRETEVRRLWHHIEEGPRSSLVMVDGDDGAARSRFLDSVRAGAADRGWTTLSCALSPERPLQTLIETVSQLGAQVDPNQARGPLEQLAQAERTVARGADRSAIRSALVALVRARCAHDPTPAMLLIHDVHHGDPPTLDLLANLRRALVADPVPFKIVASARSVELDGTAEVARRLGDGFRITLPPLDPRDVAVAVGNMLGRRPPPAELARRLHGVTAGQPEFVEAAVHDLVARGGIEAEGNRIAWADQSMEVAPPEAASEAARQLLARQPVAARRVLEALAVSEDGPEPAVLGKVVGWTAPELADVLQRLVGGGVLRWRPGSLLRPEWRSPVLQAQVDAAIHPCRRALLIRLVADAARGTAPGRRGVRAMVASGRMAEAVRAAVVSGRNAVARSRVRTGLGLMSPVVERIGDHDRQAELSELFLLYAHCLRTVGPSDPVTVRYLARARGLAEANRDPVLTTRAMLSQARLFAAIGHYVNYRKTLKSAWDARPGNVPTLAAEIATELAASYRLAGDLPKAEHWVEEAGTHADLADDSSLQAAVATEAASCHLARARLREAEEASARAMSLAEQTDHRSGYATALARWSTALRHQARYSEALARLYQTLPEAYLGEDPKPYIELLLATAWIELDLSRLGRAQECADELAATISRGEYLHLRLEAQLLTGKTQLASGQYPQAAYTLQEVQRGARHADLPVLAEYARALHAETLFALGDREGAGAAFHSAVLGLVAAGDQPVLAEGLRGRARTAATERDPAELFKPALRLLEEQPMPALLLEAHLARGAWARSRGDRGGAHAHLQDAATLLNRIASELNDTDRAALRVHPWSTWIRRGLAR